MDIAGNKKIAFVTEMNFVGKIPANHINMRTEFAWMHALNADHYCIYNLGTLKNYDHVFVIFPKGRVFLSAEGSRLVNEVNPVSHLLSSNVIEQLKAFNKKVYYVQEGPHWWYNDYELEDQIYFYNMVSTSDAIYAHNTSDVNYYKGLFPTTPVYVLPSLMITNAIDEIVVNPKEKVIIGGNFSRWYGGFESYAVAQEFNLPIWGQSSHSKRDGEEQLVNILPRMLWLDWMKALSSFKFAVHLMPTVAAGTFSLNCAYFGIPCIGSIDVDTQKMCHPDLSVRVSDIKYAKELAMKLKTDVDFYTYCSKVAKENYNLHYNQTVFMNTFKDILS